MYTGKEFEDGKMSMIDKYENWRPFGICHNIIATEITFWKSKYIFWEPMKFSITLYILIYFYVALSSVIAGHKCTTGSEYIEL